MPILEFDTVELVPEGLKEGAKKNDLGKFTVNVVLESKLSEFRDNNVKLSKERDDLKGVVDKITPLLGEKKLEEFVAEITDLKTISQRVADGKLKTTEEIEAALEKRTQQMREGYDRQLADQAQKAAASEDRAKVADRKYKQSLIDRTITDAVLNEKSGVETQALPDILNRAYGVFHVEDNGTIVPRDGEAAVIYGADGATPMTAGEWLETLKPRAPHFFKGSSGGGANGSKSKVDYNGMSREEFNKLPAMTRLKLANDGKVRNQ